MMYQVMLSTLREVFRPSTERLKFKAFGICFANNRNKSGVDTRKHSPFLG